jgi:hypothetical protein
LTFMVDLRELGRIDEMHRRSPTHLRNIIYKSDIRKPTEF